MKEEFPIKFGTGRILILIHYYLLLLYTFWQLAYQLGSPWWLKNRWKSWEKQVRCTYRMIIKCSSGLFLESLNRATQKRDFTCDLSFPTCKSSWGYFQIHTLGLKGQFASWQDIIKQFSLLSYTFLIFSYWAK